MLIAEEYLGPVGVGITAPRYFCADDGKIYVVKLQNNRLGPTVLASELLAAKFGAFMGLCFPNSGMIEISEELLEKQPELVAAGVTAGRHFASQYLDNAEYLQKDNLEKAVNIAEMAGVILFDHMFHNADRSGNKKNLLLRREGDVFKIYAIDNSHLFRAGRWTANSLKRLCRSMKVYYPRTFGLMLKDRLYANDFLPYLEKVKKLSDEEIDNIVREIPVEWLPDEEQRKALSGFIRTRRDLSEEIWEHLCRNIPQARGGRRRDHHKIIGLTWNANETGHPRVRRRRLSLGKRRKEVPDDISLSTDEVR